MDAQKIIDSQARKVIALQTKQKKLLKTITRLEKQVDELQHELKVTRYLQQEVGLLKIAELSPGYQLNN